MKEIIAYYREIIFISHYKQTKQQIAIKLWTIIWMTREQKLQKLSKNKLCVRDRDSFVADQQNAGNVAKTLLGLRFMKRWFVLNSHLMKWKYFFNIIKIMD